MNLFAPPMHGSRLPLRTRFALWLRQITHGREWRHRARASDVLDAVLATASDAIFFVDSRGKVRDCNLVAEQMFGRDRPEMIGRGIALYLPSLAFSALRRRAKGMGHDALSLEMPGRIETLATDQSGRAFPASVAVRSLAVWRDKGCIVRVRDDSRREADRQEIRRLMDQLNATKQLLNASAQSQWCDRGGDAETQDVREGQGASLDARLNTNSV